jgi:hypothetical protein
MYGFTVQFGLSLLETALYGFVSVSLQRIRSKSHLLRHSQSTGLFTSQNITTSASGIPSFTVQHTETSQYEGNKEPRFGAHHLICMNGGDG